MNSLCTDHSFLRMCFENLFCDVLYKGSRNPCFPSLFSPFPVPLPSLPSLNCSTDAPDPHFVTDRCFGELTRGQVLGQDWRRGCGSIFAWSRESLETLLHDNQTSIRGNLPSPLRALPHILALLRSSDSARDKYDALDLNQDSSYAILCWSRLHYVLFLMSVQGSKGPRRFLGALRALCPPCSRRSKLSD